MQPPHRNVYRAVGLGVLLVLGVGLLAGLAPAITTRLALTPGPPVAGLTRDSTALPTATATAGRPVAPILTEPPAGLAPGPSPTLTATATASGSPPTAGMGPATVTAAPSPLTPQHSPLVAAGPNDLTTVPADAFPPHHGIGDRRFGVVEAFADPARATDLGVGWERVQIRWDELQPRGPLQWDANATQNDVPYDAEIAHGRHLVAVIQGVPAWAAQDPAEGSVSVPKNLDLPWYDPRNYWGQFVFRAARHYAGRIDTLVILNEVNISTGPYRQFDGTVQDYARMLRVAYLAAHAANPRVQVHIYGDSVFADQGAWFRATVDALARFPDARANNFFFDAAEVHLYNTIINWDTLLAGWHADMRAHGFDRPIWLSETNIAPRNDYVSPALPTDHNALLSVQPDFIVASFATALGLGLPREEVYQMLDPRHIWPEHPYGLVRRDGSVRPEYAAFKTISTWLSGVTATRYQPGGEPYAEQHPVFRVVMERPGQEVQVLWDGSGRAVDTTVPAVAPTATLVQPDGATSTLTAQGGRFTIPLAPATDRSVSNPNLYIVGGPPLIVVQDLPAGQHVAGLRPLFVEADRSAGAGTTLGPAPSLAIAPDGSGRRAIADTAHDRVLIADAAGRIVTDIGGTGGAPGRFRGPMGVAIGADGTLYVADTGNARIQEFDLSGRLLGGFGAYGTSGGGLEAPSAVAVAPDGTLYVVDSAQDAVLHFTRMGAFLGRWGEPGHGFDGLDGPGGIAVDASGTVYVADTLNNRVVAFDAQGHPVSQIGSGQESGRSALRWPVSVAVLASGALAIADAGDGRVVVVNPRRYLGSTPLTGVEQAGGLTIAPDGSYYVSDTAADRIVHLDASGRLLGSFGSRGFGAGQFFQPAGLAMGPDGDLYVADSGNNRIEKLTTSGHMLAAYGRQGNAPGEFLGPHAVSVAPDGTIWVADTDNARIQRMSPASGAFTVVVRGVNGAWGVDGDAKGGVYYSARWGQRVYYLDRGGHVVVWGAPGSGSSELDHPAALGASADGSSIYVVDEGNARIQDLDGGEITGSRGGPNPGDAGLADPVAVAVGADGAISVLDAARHRIVRYLGAASDDLSGRTVEGAALAVAPDANGRVAALVVDPWSGTTTLHALAVSGS